MLGISVAAKKQLLCSPDTLQNYLLSLQGARAAAEMCMMSFKKETPLANAAFWAARKGNLALLQLLLNSGRVDVDCRDSTGTTALMVASYGGHTQCVRELVLHGADINLQRESGATALFFAAQQGHDEIVKFLFEFGASTEFITRDGGTALLAACQHGHAKVVETLLKNGANIHDQLFDGATSLFMAAQGGYVDVIRLLLTYGAKANQPRQDGTSALFKAAAKGFSDVIEELLKFSPTLGVLKNGSTALHAAVLGGSIKSVALLLEAGANPSMRNKANELPADLTQNERILRLLKTSETKCIRP
ncbi:ankyrin repeat domain-containing protein 29 isoform X2 [Rana temporaria]|uniref:ankyrin repeat domain-containing protein 29 isoform X2 n=1 Tax=Rana temporaria TaxID=8407 RepID=UPI001AAD9FC9|nr:ankyrin repeat domain-containing protein 29 isoform X2 [Rana temporaria]